MNISNNENYWKGKPMDVIYEQSNGKFQHFPELFVSKDNKILFEFPQVDKTNPPIPYAGRKYWDSNHVHLPCSKQCHYPIIENGQNITVTKWSLIVDALQQRAINNSYELQAAILSYNIKYKNRWNFRTLHRMFDEMDDEEALQFFHRTLPEIIKFALRLPELIRCGIPLLKRNQNKSITFSQLQIACLMANAFLCTYPRRNTHKKNSEYRNFPDINFNRIFSTNDNQSIEKLKCVCNYFVRVCTIKEPCGVVTMIRRSISEFPNWNRLTETFTNTCLHVSADGKIEDDGKGLLQVDFANKYLGGGVLNSGCVQEEIRFVICPELIISKLIMEKLQPNEAAFLIGCERYSNYSGYASTFEWTGSHYDDTPYDEHNRRECCIVAIDALYFNESRQQFTEMNMCRELKKAYVGFFSNLQSPPAVATGNWGCGVFRGDKSLKATIQLIICCIARRPLVYYTFGDRDFVNEFNDFYNFIVSEKITIGKLWMYLNQFQNAKGYDVHQLFPFIYSYHYSNISSCIDGFLSPEKPNETNGAKFNEIAKSPVPSTSSSSSSSAISLNADGFANAKLMLKQTKRNMSLMDLDEYNIECDRAPIKKCTNQNMVNDHLKQSLATTMTTNDNDDQKMELDDSSKSLGVNNSLNLSESLIDEYKNGNKISADNVLQNNNNNNNEVQDGEFNFDDDDAEDAVIPETPPRSTNPFLKSKNKQLQISDYFKKT